MRINSLDAGLDDLIAALEARELCHVNGRSLEAVTNSGSIHDRILFGVNDDPQFFLRIEKDLVVIMHATCETIEACGHHKVIFRYDDRAYGTLRVFGLYRNGHCE